MRKAIRDLLVMEVASQFEKRLPEFRRCGAKCDSQGEIVWRWEGSESLTFFILLNVADDADNFAIEIGWSMTGKYPWEALSHRFQKLEAPACRGRLSVLWVMGKTEYRWEIVPGQTYEQFRARMAARRRGDFDEAERIDKLGEMPIEQAMARVGPLVDDAVAKTAEYGAPLFRRVIEAHLTRPAGGSPS
jgi:hypothetical protein